MERIIFDGFGCQILLRKGNYYICYDSGESAGSSLLENKITLEESKKAQNSEQDAYEVILAAQNRKEN